MSFKLVEASLEPIDSAMRSSTRHTPRDDLESAVWVIIWVVLCKLNGVAPWQGHQGSWYLRLHGGDYQAIMIAKSTIRAEALETDPENYGPLFPQFPTLSKFIEKIFSLSKEKVAKSHVKDYGSILKEFNKSAVELLDSRDPTLDRWPTK